MIKEYDEKMFLLHHELTQLNASYNAEKEELIVAG